MRYSLIDVMLTVLALVVVSAMTALAVDYYVDGTNGDDAYSGIHPHDAWKTITHAINALDTSEGTPATIHVAPGIYAASTNGETFPVEFESHVAVVGEDPSTTVLDAEFQASHLIISRDASSVQIQGISLLHCALAAGSGYNGCAVYCTNSELLIENCVIAENVFEKTDQASALCVESSQLAERQCTLRDNRTDARIPNLDRYPGTIRCHQSVLTISESEVSRNEDWFGTIFVSDNSCLTLDRSTITENDSGFDFDWGGVLLCWDSQLVLLGSQIVRNRGCAVSLDGFNRAIVSRCLLSSGTGQVISTSLMDVSIEDCLIRGNTGVWGSPGGFYCYGAHLDFQRCVIEKNHALGALIELWTRYGGGLIPSSHVASLAIKDTLIKSNVVDHGPVIFVREEGGVCVGSTKSTVSPEGYLFEIRRSTITGNRRADQPLGSECPRRSALARSHPLSYSAKLRVQDTVFSDNTLELNQFYDDWGGSDRVGPVDHCSLEGSAYPGGGNMHDVDPIFASGPLGDYYLSSIAAGQEADSPCIDAGSTSASIAGVSHLTTRTDGAFDTGWLDIGYHYSATPPTIECFVSAGSEPLAPGDTLSASVSIENAGLPLWVDVYAGFILPDGSIFCAMPGGLTTDLVSWAATSHLPRDFASGDITVFEVQLPEGLLDGTYTFAAALSLTGAFRPIGDIASAHFALE